MARVHNWQIGRDMSYWYPENRPQKQFAAVFDINKCIACQTCTLACKTTWTSGKGQEYMLWNNVESKPYGFYPLSWDLKLLQMLGAQPRPASACWVGGQTSAITRTRTSARTIVPARSTTARTCTCRI
jgi:nitrate reductase beta subunit